MHEVNGPLEAIFNLNYLARINANDAARVRHYSDLIEEQLGALKSISRQTLSFYHSQEALESVPIATVVEAALRIHRSKIAAKEIRVFKKLPAEVIVECHAGTILQVFSNLIGNALEAMPVRGILQVRARCADGSAHFLVADNGHGIPAGIRLRIFEPFFSTKKEHGTGLGLAITKAVLERHCGRIKCRTSAETGLNGTVFRVSLPLRSAAAAA